MSRVLILSCSKSKRADAGLLPAINRYTGPLYKTFRKTCAQHPNVLTGLDVYILSAEYGIIGAMTPIPNYDRKMDVRRAHALRTANTIALTEILAGGVDDLCLCMSQLYLSSISAELLSQTPHFFCDGDLFTKPGQLKNWLLKILRFPA